MLNVYIDADGCSVRDETYRVATRYKLKVFVVANKWMGTPDDSLVEMVVVSGGFDAADDWIVDRGETQDVVITSDILLAQRCVQKGMAVLGPKGIEFTEDSIGDAVANRELMQNLRHMGDMRGGPRPMEARDRSRFLNQFDQIVQRILRSKR